ASMGFPVAPTMTEPPGPTARPNALTNKPAPDAISVFLPVTESKLDSFGWIPTTGFPASPTMIEYAWHAVGRASPADTRAQSARNPSGAIELLKPALDRRLLRPHRDARRAACDPTAVFEAHEDPIVGRVKGHETGSRDEDPEGGRGLGVDFRRHAG